MSQSNNQMNTDGTMAIADVLAGEALRGEGQWRDDQRAGLPPPRRPWIAVLLALLSPMAGILYAGAPRWVWPFLAAQILMAVWLLAGWTSSFVGFFGYLAVLIVQGLAGMAVAGVIANRNREVKTLARYQRYWIYLFIIVAFGAFQRLAATIEGPAAVGIESSSMFPTIWSGDLVLATGGRYTRYKPSRGDIVVYWHPHQPGERWIKRIIGLPGDTLTMRDGLIVIDEVAVTQEVIAPYVWTARPHVTLTFHQKRETWPASLDPDSRSFNTVHVGDLRSDYHNLDGLVVPEGHVFVMGDYRDNSLDSRASFHGPLPIDNITHRVEGILWSKQRDLSLVPVYAHRPG